MDLGDLDGDNNLELVYIAKGKAPNGGEAFDLRALRRDASGTFKTHYWAGPAEFVSIAGLNGPPAGLKTIDVNRDGLMDFLIFTGYGSPILLLGSQGKPPSPFAGSLARWRPRRRQA